MHDFVAVCCNVAHSRRLRPASPCAHWRHPAPVRTTSGADCPPSSWICCRAAPIVRERTSLRTAVSIVPTCTLTLLKKNPKKKIPEKTFELKKPRMHGLTFPARETVPLCGTGRPAAATVQGWAVWVLSSGPPRVHALAASPSHALALAQLRAGSPSCPRPQGHGYEYGRTCIHTPQAVHS